MYSLVCFGYTRSFLEAFSSCSEGGLLSRCGAGASRGGGLSWQHMGFRRCGSWAILCHHGAVLPTASRGDEVEPLGSALCVLVHWVFNPISQAYPGMPGPKKVSLKPYNLEEDEPDRTRWCPLQGRKSSPCAWGRCLSSRKAIKILELPAVAHKDLLTLSLFFLPAWYISQQQTTERKKYVKNGKLGLSRDYAKESASQKETGAKE